MALERASAFVDVVAQGLRVEARHMVRQAEAKAGSETATAADLAEAHVMRSRSAKLMHTAGNLIATSKDFRHGAQLWRRDRRFRGSAHSLFLSHPVESATRYC